MPGGGVQRSVEGHSVERVVRNDERRGCASPFWPPSVARLPQHRMYVMQLASRTYLRKKLPLPVARASEGA